MARKIDIPSEEFPLPENTSSARKISISNDDISRFKSLVSAPIKGLLKALPEVAKFQEPLSFLFPKEKEREFYDQQIEKMLPTRPEAIESGLERFGKILPEAAVGGVGGIVRGALSAGAGQFTEELGGGPFSQAIAEAAAFGLPSLGRKIIPSSAEQSKILDLGRRSGMSEKQLAPLMPETAKRRFFGRYASTGESSQNLLKETRSGIGNIYDNISKKYSNLRPLSNAEMQKFSQDMNTIGMKMPAAIRGQLKQDALDLVSAARKKGGMFGEDMINFYHDVSSNHNMNRQQLELFKNPIREALSKIDPKLAEDFATTNRMFQKSLQIGRVLRPSEYEKLISLGEVYELAASAGTLDVGRLSRLLGTVGMRKFSEKMLTSPRLQNIIKKSQDALIKNSAPQLKKIGDLLQYELHRDEDD